jgi:CPA1 family monovalent cation:H+ antiporter
MINMELTTFIMILIVAIVFSNLMDSAFPKLPLPLIQIACGVAIALTPLDTEMSIDPELFMGVLIAPLLFREAEEADIPGMWRLRKTVVFMVFGLVFLTVFIVGFSVHSVVPEIPLAACFCLGSALGPTDAIAVSSVSNRIEIGGKVMNILKGEFLINDATGVISFNFAALALVTGAFSLFDAGISLLILCSGGIAVGLVIGQVKNYAVRTLKRASIRSSAAFMLIEILTPFLCFFLAEHLGVSGIIAAVTAGTAQAFRVHRLEKFEAEFASLKKSAWEMITVVFNSFIFILLGLQLPSMVESVSESPWYSVGFAMVVGLFATVLLFAVRFVGVVIGARDIGESRLKERFRSWALLTLSGVKGTVSLATAFSLPLVIQGNSEFIHRDILLLITACAIIYSLIISTTLLPLIAKPKPLVCQNCTYVRIIRDVIPLIREQGGQSADAVVIHLKRRARELEYEDMEKSERKALIALRREFFQRELVLLEKRHKDGILAEGEYAIYHRLLSIIAGMTEGSLFSRGIKVMTFAFRSKSSSAREFAKWINESRMNDGQIREIFWQDTSEIGDMLLREYGEEMESIISRVIEERIDLMSDVMERAFGEHIGIHLHEEYDRAILRCFDLERSILSKYIADGIVSDEEAHSIRVDINTLETFAIEDYHNDAATSFARRRFKKHEERHDKLLGRQDN